MDRRGRFASAHDRMPRADVGARIATPHRIAWATCAWVFILAVIGVVQIVRAQAFDAAVFFVAAAAVALDGAGMFRQPRRRMRLDRRVLPAAAVLTGAGLCFLPRHSAAMQAAVILTGVVAVALAWPGLAIARPHAQTVFSSGVRRLTLAWVVIVITGCIWELIQFILGLVQPGAHWFSLSDLLNPTVAAVPGRVAFIAVWVAGGVWLLRRGGVR